ncbi:MAG: hypothetical protein SPI72_03320 [Porphyromonas sp.]|nr:hypothetical protein [Porphyromonas sp.]
MGKQSFVLHDETVNTYGFRMLTSGANLDEFRKNPVMLLNHNDWSLPIGRWENIRVEGSRILADPVFDLKDEEARKVAAKVEENFIRMASIGAWPPEEVSDDPSLKLQGQRGATVTKWTVREASIVTIGANHNALAFYDRANGSRIDLKNESTLIQLMDDARGKFPPQSDTNQSTGNMKINQLLNLADNATQTDIENAIVELSSERDQLKQRNQELSDTIARHNAERKEAQKAEAIALVDTAISDGRIDAKSKDVYLKLFDADHQSAKLVLGSIAVRKSIAEQIENSRNTEGANLKDLESKSWDELDRSDKLTELKDNSPEVYAKKFKERFGIDLKSK